VKNLKRGEDMKKYFSVILLFIFLTTIVGWTYQGSGTIKTQQNVNNKFKITQNKSLTDSILKEKNVLGGQIYVQNGTVYGAIVMSKKTTANYAKTIGNKYLKLIKVKYKNTRVNLQIVSSNKSLYISDTKK
jgi:hypothetical protein